jgi:hypothetical protein
MSNPHSQQTNFTFTKNAYIRFSPKSETARANALQIKPLTSTLIYTQLVESESDEYCSAVAGNVDEAKKLIEAGFECVCSHNETMLFRK